MIGSGTRVRWLAAGGAVLLLTIVVLYSLGESASNPLGMLGPLESEGPAPAVAPAAEGGERLYPPSEPQGEGAAEGRRSSVDLSDGEARRGEAGEGAAEGRRSSVDLPGLGDVGVRSSLGAARDRADPAPENALPLENRGSEPEPADLDAVPPGDPAGLPGDRPSADLEGSARDEPDDQTEIGTTLPDGVIEAAVRDWNGPDKCGVMVGEGAPGELELVFVVGRDGQATARATRQVDGPREARYARCLEDSLGSLRFPPVSEPVETTATFVF